MPFKKAKVTLQLQRTTNKERPWEIDGSRGLIWNCPWLEKVVRREKVPVGGGATLKAQSPEVDHLVWGMVSRPASEERRVWDGVWWWWSDRYPGARTWRDFHVRRRSLYVMQNLTEPVELEEGAGDVLPWFGAYQNPGSWVLYVSQTVQGFAGHLEQDYCTSPVGT